MPQTTLITASDLRDRFDIDGSDESMYPDPRILPSIRSASRRLRAWVGDAMYQAALDLVNTPNAAVDNSTMWELQSCEAYLTMHYAILGFNSPISSKGVLQTSTSSEAKEIRRYLAPKEITELAQAYLDQADEIKRQVLLTAGVAPIAEPMPSVDVLEIPGEATTREYWCGPCGASHELGFDCTRSV